MTETATGQASYFDYWAKTDRDDPSPVPRHHLLPYHGLDVAACAYVLLREERSLRRRLAALLQTTEESTVGLVTFLVALHDMGKFSESFQNKNRHLFEHLRKRTSRKDYHVYHDTLGFHLWMEHMGGRAFAEDWFGLQECGVDRFDFIYAFEPLIAAVTGHHGRPPNVGAVSHGTEYFDEESTEAALDYANQCRELFVDPPVWSEISGFLEDDTPQASWLLAGLTVAADWLGSNQDYFEFSSQRADLSTYWKEVALPAARMAVSDSGMVSSRPSTNTGIRALFDFETPTPMQQHATQVELGEGPQLFVLEDATGSGKTEAALTLAHRIMAAGKASGIYVALPTMATANAMYGRLGENYERLYEDPSNVSLILAHGARDLSDAFRKSLELGAHSERADEAYDAAGNELSGTAQCTRWLADHRKKALLAGVGVGTIDQALMGVLPSRHQSLRLLGMSRSVLIVDEVHAYDPYMSELLMTMLEFHASNGGSAILLSATLPKVVRQQLCDAFQVGCGDERTDLEHAHFPMATHIAEGIPKEAREVEIKPRQGSERVVPVAFEDEVSTCVERLVDVATCGGCACWIRNTVNDAIDAYHFACEKLDPEDVILFHARFTMADRQGIEQRVLELFGPDSTPAERAGKVVIATQVVEQSLDLDFDFMISDLAPIELLIQRAGRLHRHERPGRDEPLFLIHGPHPEENVDQDWYKDVLPSASYVYPDVARLWLGAKTLVEQEAIRIPEQARKLVESVYGVDIAESAPEALVEASGDAYGEMKVDRSMGRLNSLNFDRGYGAESSLDWFEDTRTPTRLGDPTTTLRLGRVDGDKIKPWASDGRARWRRSEVGIRTSKVAGEASWSGTTANAAAAAKETMRDRGEWSVLVPLRASERGTWRGEARDPQGNTVIVIYSNTFGLQIEKDTDS